MIKRETARERILGRIGKSSLEANPMPLKIESLHCVDALSTLDNETRFTTNATLAASEILTARSKSNALSKTIELIDREGINSSIVTGIKELLHDPLGRRLTIRIDEKAKIGISEASFGIAETGSLVLFGGIKNPTSVNFLPDLHVVFLNSGNILHSVAEAFNELSNAAKENQLPRAINIISGPSRTADIEQTLQLGAHGPKRLIIVIINENIKNDA